MNKYKNKGRVIKMRRKKLSNRRSKRLFRSKSGHHKKNRSSNRSYRGGGRL